MNIKTLPKWWYLLNKRLLKKPCFVALLLLLPLLVVGLRLVATQEAGVITIALSCEDWEDSTACSVIDDLMSDNGVIRFNIFEDPTDAQAAVYGGKADMAWIMKSNLSERIREFVKNADEDFALVTVFEREGLTAKQLAKEKLFGALFGYCSTALYEDFLARNLNTITVSQEQIDSFYESVNIDSEIFETVTYSGLNTPESGAAGYIIAPLRGLLAIIAVLCGLATTLFYLSDKNSGFLLRPGNRKVFSTALCYYSTALTDVGIVMLGSIFISGFNGDAPYEILSIAAFLLSVCGFSMLIGQIIGRTDILSVFMPIITALMLVFCPIFFNLGKMRIVQLLFPPYYYLNAVGNSKYIVLMLIYGAITLTVSYTLMRIRDSK